MAEGGYAIFKTGGIIEAVAVAGEADDVGGVSFGGGVEGGGDFGEAIGVVFSAVEAHGDGVGGEHGGDEVKLAEGGEMLRADEVDTLQTNLGAEGGKLGEGESGVAPVANGLEERRRGRGHGRLREVVGV